MPTPEEAAVSLGQKADAIQDARSVGYNIFAISLNADGTANSGELTQIAKATGGQFREVAAADDLEDVFNLYYTLIFSSKLSKGDDMTFPASGVVSGSFEIPPVGVEEFNIVLSGKATDYSLADPSGRLYDKAALANSTYSSETFNIIKITGPAAGVWNYSVSGIPGDNIRVNIVYNTDISNGINANPQKDVYITGDTITITAYLTQAGRAVEAGRYDGFTARLSISDGRGNANTIDMEIGADGFTYGFAPARSGTYSVRANITSKDYDIHTDSLLLNVDNTPPVKIMDIEETVKLWPFSDNKKTIDLAPCASDAQDSELTYEVESSAFLDDEYSLQGSKLTISGYSLPRGSFTIRAYDSDGAFCTFEVAIKTINITLIGFLLLAGGILVALAIAAAILWAALNKRFMGKCYVTQFDSEGNYYEEKMREKGRGRLPLYSFNLVNSGFNTTKCYFQASGKDYAFFCTDIKMYGDGLYDKKFRVEGDGYEISISPDQAGQSGIRVRFVSRLNRTSFF